ncbi:MAG: sensor histidine kinase KdpD [Candidatus Eremiobacterota bacterium]
MDDILKRPDPDHLLNLLKDEEHKKERTRGYLKIFLGYVAGVGKTYRMLTEARLLKQKGYDVITGIVETHQRAETEVLLDGLEIVPKKKIDYKGIALEEMDLDEIIRRKPEYVLVDELAHTNVPGSRHVKRYHDVEELLNSGISVYTTVNIQHVESLNEIIYQITQIEVKETVPDSIFEMADKIELVDLPVDEHLQRLGEGKVYIPEKAKVAASKFFREGNLLALRELSLRYTAKRVDDAMLSYMKLHKIKGIWQANARLLVCISPSPTSEHLIHMTQRYADDLNADWYAVYVESPVSARLREEQKMFWKKTCILPKNWAVKL